MKSLPYGRRTGDSQERLRSAIDTLPHPSKQIARLAMFEQKSIAEIADDLRMGVGEVESLWSNTVTVLQRRLALVRI